MPHYFQGHLLVPCSLDPDAHYRNLSFIDQNVSLVREAAIIKGIPLIN